MKLSQVYLKVISGSLTCSEVLDLLMDQPTASGESHAQMHMTEGFKLKKSGFSGNDFSFKRKQLHWEQPTHLYPKGDKTYDWGRFLVAGGYTGSTDLYGGVYQETDRIASDKSYVTRTGMPDLPKLTKKTYTVYKFNKPRSAPDPVTYNTDPRTWPSHSQLEVGNGQVGKFAGIKDKGTNNVVLKVKENEQTLAPPVRASPAHSMFPDGESMVMHLAAALLSDAGKRIVHHLKFKIKPGEQKTVGIFSKTAVLAVAKVDKQSVKLIQRKQEVDTTQPRDPITGFYPLTGKTITEELDKFDHVVVVLGHRVTGDLNVITCYPSVDTTSASIGTATGPTEDIAEFTFGTHSKVTQTNALPNLKW